jgi:hypothetical protein
MIFEVGKLKVTTPLEPKEGRRYIKPMKGDEIDNLYNMTGRMEDYVNPTIDDALSWISINSCTSNSKAGLENW